MPSLRSAGKSVAEHLPEALGPTLVRAHAAARPRFWRVVMAWRRLIAESERWSPAELEAYQLKQLRQLLQHSYANVPYYREALGQLGAYPEDFLKLADVQRLPLIGKQELQERQKDLLATNFSERERIYFTSAGSTGVPVGFYHDTDTSAKEWAFMTSQWRRVGYCDGDRSAVLRGTVIPHGRLFAPSPLRNALIMSSYHLTEDRLPLYVARLREFRPKFIQSYPSSATLLASHMLSTGEKPIESLRAVLCGSENLYPWQRRQIEEAFGCRVFSWYGQSERVCLAGECERDTSLHIFPQYGLTELIDKDGNPVEHPGKIGEIVATGFLNRSMPLIRYRTTDLALLSSGQCVGCSRTYARLERIEGRLQEFIVTEDRRYVSMTAINMHSPVFDNIFQFRFQQSTPGEVILRVVPKRTYTQEDESRIRQELAPKLGEDVQLAIEVVPEIPRQGRGKFRFLDQDLPMPFNSQQPHRTSEDWVEHRHSSS